MIKVLSKTLATEKTKESHSLRASFTDLTGKANVVINKFYSKKKRKLKP